MSPSHPTDNSRANRLFNQGLTLFAQGRFSEATEHFEKAIATARATTGGRLRMRYVSYFGLSRALAYGPSHNELKLVERAAIEDEFDPDIQLNLGRFYLRVGRRTKALAAFERGLRLDSQHKALRAMMRKTDRRRTVIRWLHRDHAINRTLGRWRSSLSGPEAVG